MIVRNPHKKSNLQPQHLGKDSASIEFDLAQWCIMYVHMYMLFSLCMHVAAAPLTQFRRGRMLHSDECAVKSVIPEASNRILSLSWNSCQLTSEL